jgi:hypothetical protein
MSTTNENPGAERKATRESDADTRNFIETHDVTKVARKAVPGSGEEAADLVQAEQVGGLDDPKPDSSGKKGA